MNHSSLRLSHPASRLLVATLLCLPLGSACSDDEAAPAAPITFSVEISSLDGSSKLSEAVNLRCDQGGPSDAAGGAAPVPSAFSTLAVGVKLSPEFILRPANACGSSKRCGYVRIEGVDDAGQVVASVDTVTTEGVLQLDFAALPTQVRATLINGVDQKILQNPDKTDVTTSITPTFAVPAECGQQAPSAGGAGGMGGAGNGGTGGDSTLGGAGGDATALGGAGAGGDATALGGAGAGGDATTPGGAGGQNNAG